MFNELISGLYCSQCRTRYDYEVLKRSCPRCGQPLLTLYEVSKISSRIKKRKLKSGEAGVWRFKEVLPLHPKFKISLGEGGTRLLKSTSIGGLLNLDNLYLKVENLNPTGTFIDRGVSVDVSIAKTLGFKRVVTGTLGDYGVSLAAYSSKAKINALTYMPSSAELNKIYQVIMFGGRVRLLENYTKCIEEARSVSEKFNYYLSLPSSHTVIDGYKTLSYELLEDMDWKPPDYIVLPVGDGALITAIHQGFKEALEAGLYEEPFPRLIAVQSEASPRIAEKILGRISKYSRDESIASDIIVSKPLMETHAVAAVRESGGTAVIVSDEDIVDSMHKLARYEGIIVEPTSATGIAGLVKLVEEGVLEKHDKIVVILTGSTFKDPILIRKVLERSKEARTELSVLESLRGGLGETKLKILEIIALNVEIHPYKIWKILTTSYNLVIKPTTIYQHLKDLESRGLVGKTLDRGGRRVLYKLTDLGREVVGRYKPSIEV